MPRQTHDTADIQEAMAGVVDDVRTLLAVTAEVAEDKPPPMRNNEDCAMTNTTHDAHTFTADMTCNTQRMQGRGHMSVNFDSSEHYAGSYTFSGTTEGHPQNMSYNFEARWISADCGGVK